MPVTANLHECKHCSGSGTCTNGSGSTACIACAKKHELSIWRQKGQVGLMCGSCGGIGKAEPLTERLNNRAGPLLAIFLSIGLIVIIFWAAATESQYFSQLLAFGSAIIGSIVGFYFSSNRNTS